MITGAPGSGKTVLAIELVLSLLAALLPVGAPAPFRKPESGLHGLSAHRPYGRSVTAPAWQQIESERYEDFWAPFDARFDFRPSPEPYDEPAINEPAPSITIDLSPIFAISGSAQFAAAQDAVNTLGLLAMTRVFAPSQRLLVLDWHHPSWWFWPHRQALDENPRWPVEIFPDGDYYVFLSEDMANGTFGHPWEQTLCVFGASLTGVLAPLLTSWLPVKRARS
ncbi:DUF2716 domain-containing protein [Planomonospora sp. ID67723]|uniref:DUF2716 domain-containing protein n=1 Tax=Planomonospora sp. ID67723 TaxID=2738134 RepID=UPI0018C42988|nr:DUF2716 domain-containing protein [Planomonospora sp. ID67723]MBG0831646.1 DUF2716 domain-containing protein [Planomonospora sp. ID67723]